jgi:cell wall-associated NlpC family hydrolase
MGHTIGYGNLLLADIIVSTTAAASSRMIRIATGGSVSHAFIYAGQNTVIEAVETEGVRVNSILHALEKATLAIALRYPGLSQEKRQQVIANARSFVGRGYDFVGAGGSLKGRRGKLMYIGACAIVGALPCAGGRKAIKDNATPEHADEKFFCSELVARAFEKAGAPIVDGASSYANPRMVRYSEKLQYVGHLIDA